MRGAAVEGTDLAHRSGVPRSNAALAAPDPARLGCAKDVVEIETWRHQRRAATRLPTRRRPVRRPDEGHFRDIEHGDNLEVLLRLLLNEVGG